MTALMGTMHVVVHSSSNLLAPDENISRFTQDEIQRRIYGSKMVLVVEQMQCCTIWLVKACLLLMYTRMTYVTTMEFEVSSEAELIICLERSCHNLRLCWSLPGILPLAL